MRHAVQNRELELHYQPVVDSKTSRICGAEALVSWRHSVNGMIFSGEFISPAEETGIIMQIGE